MEKQIHEKFKDVRRYGTKNEFFILTKDAVSQYFDKANRSLQQSSELHEKEKMDLAHELREIIKERQDMAQERTSKDAEMAKERTEMAQERARKDKVMEDVLQKLLDRRQ